MADIQGRFSHSAHSHIWRSALGNPHLVSLEHELLYCRMGFFATLRRFSHGCLLRVSRNAPTRKFVAEAPAAETPLRRERCYILLVTIL